MNGFLSLEHAADLQSVSLKGGAQPVAVRTQAWQGSSLPLGRIFSEGKVL
jgi:hypothetical protein